MNFIRKFQYRKASKFSIDDPRAVAEAERLIGKHRSVWALMNKRDLTYAFYIPSNEGGSIYLGTEGGTSSAYSQPKSGGGFFSQLGPPPARASGLFHRIAVHILTVRAGHAH